MMDSDLWRGAMAEHAATGPVMLHRAELARLRRVEAAARALRAYALADEGAVAWWERTDDARWFYCCACADYGRGLRPGEAAMAVRPHAPDCAAMALDAALAER